MENSGTARLKILSFGAGAIGTYIGGSLALHGAQLVFLERPEFAKTLQTTGLHLEIKGQTNTLPQPVVVSSLADAFNYAPFDAALFALKSFDTQGALAEIQPWAEQMPPVICLQNGVENEAALARELGEARVVPGTVTSAIGRRGPGHIVLERLRGIGLAAGHPLSRPLAAAMQQAGLNPRLYARPREMKWSKLLTNLLANATSAILDMPPAEIFAHPGLFRLEIAQLREALAVMYALRLSVVDLPGTPVRALAFAVQNLPLSLARLLMAKAVGGGRGAKMPSFHIDLHSGRGASEVDYLNGAVVRHAEQLNLKAPANRLLNETLLALSRKDKTLDSFRRQPEKLLTLLEM